MRPRLPEPGRVYGYLSRMQSARIYSNFGPLVREFEARLADHLNVRAEQVVLSANATLALQGACQIAKHRRVVVPSYTFPASAMAVVHAGSQLVLRDIDPKSWKLDSDLLGAGLNQVLMPVMPFGSPVDLETFADHEWVIVDAAASIGAPAELSSLPRNWSVIYSLHATKVMGIGEGGAAVFGSAEQAREFRSWTNFGFSGTRESQVIGTNAKMSEIAAAFGLAALDEWPTELTEWSVAKSRSAQVDEALGIGSLTRHYPGVSPYWIAAFADSQTRGNVEEALKASEIGSRRWWSWGCHRMDAFADYVDGEYPVTDHVAGTTLGLPISRDSTQSEFDEVREVVSSAMRGHRP